MTRRFAQLFALSGLAVAQPLFDLLGRNPEFFAVRGATPAQIVVFALALVLVPPLALLAVEALVPVFHAVFVGGLCAALALQALRSLEPAAAFALAAGIGVVAVVAFVRFAAVRSLATVLAFAPLVFLALFLFRSPTSELVRVEEAQAQAPAVRATTPVVLVVLDELPTVSLMDRDGRIDAVRFSSFARLGRDSIWFRNATTVAEGTTHAVPAILTGRHSRPKLLPRYADHRENLFTLLGGSYDVEGFEVVTRVCPPAMCREASRGSFGGQLRSLVEDAGVVYGHVLLSERLARRLPSVSESWSDFLGAEQTEPERFERFLASIGPRGRPTLRVLHLLLPHSPWQYLPSGERSSTPYRGVLWGRDEVWTRDAALVAEARRRHLLQLGYTDRLLGRLLDRLRSAGRYDRTLLIVTADHGISFRPGSKRRPVWPENLHDIAFVPLLVKLPGATRGSTSDRHVQTIDVVPTIADVLGIGMPWRLDGRSLLENSPSNTVLLGGGEVVVYKDGGDAVAAPLSELVRRRASVLAKTVALFGRAKKRRLNDFD